MAKTNPDHKYSMAYTPRCSCGWEGAATTWRSDCAAQWRKHREACESGADPKAFRLVKNGQTWDCSEHRDDVESWRDKVLREEPDAIVEIKPISTTQLNRWRQG